MNKFTNIVMLFVALIFADVITAQSSMAPVQKKSILLINGHAHLGNGKNYIKSIIGIKDGKIAEVYNANIVDYKNLKYDSIIDLEGKHIYPGFIAPNSALGIREIDQVRATHDYAETGKINPNVRSIIAYNTDSKITPTVRSNGILLAQITPRGGLISGTSSVVELDGWNWEDALFKENDGIHLQWPHYVLEDVNKTKDKKDVKESREEIRRKQIQLLEDFFNDAKAYLNASFNYEINLRYEAMRGVFSGKKALYIHAEHIRDLTEAIYFKKRFDIPRMTIVGGADSWRIPELFVDNHVSIMLLRVHSLPYRKDEDIDLPYKLPKLLDDAGILFCLENSGGMEVMNTRNLPFYAGTARAYGLSEEKAIQSITLNAAKILGIDERVGSLEAGKDATLIVSSGDALDMMSNNIEIAFVRGRSIDLNNHQKDLYNKFKAKYEGN